MALGIWQLVDRCDSWGKNDSNPAVCEHFHMDSKFLESEYTLFVNILAAFPSLSIMRPGYSVQDWWAATQKVQIQFSPDPKRITAEVDWCGETTLLRKILFEDQNKGHNIKDYYYIL